MMAHSLRVIRIVVLRVGLADERVGADVDLVAERHFFFHFFVERRAENADDDQRHAEVDDVSAIAPRVAAGELKHALKRF